jgi:hypothetical protein
MGAEMSEPTGPFGNGNGRDGKGRFAPGNPGGPGNPNASKIAKLRGVVYMAITQEDMRKNVQRLRDVRDDPKSKPADVIAAVKALNEMAIGGTADLVERIEVLEQRDLRTDDE